MNPQETFGLLGRCLAMAAIAVIAVCFLVVGLIDKIAWLVTINVFVLVAIGGVNLCNIYFCIAEINTTTKRLQELQKHERTNKDYNSILN